MSSEEDYQKKFIDFCDSKGMNRNATYEAMGNISQECSWNPNLIEEGSGIGFGLIQWSYERRTALEAYGTDFDHQLNFFYAELTGGDASIGAEKQWYDARGYTYEEYMNGSYSIADGTAAFCWCFERPNESDANIAFRQSEAQRFAELYADYNGGGGVEPNEVDNAVQWMIDIANDDTHGYDQEYRWGERGDYDCSSFVITAYEQAGIPLKTNGATYTGNLKSVAIATGFTLINPTDWNDTSQFKIGDIILNETYHVCCYIGNGQIVHASQNELGQATGGQVGDQNGQEIYVRDYYIYSHGGWDCVLRYKDGGTGGTGGGGGGNTTKGQVWEAINKTCYKVGQLSDDQITFIKTLNFGDKVKMKYTFDREKQFIGTTFFGNRLKFDNKIYIIDNVDNKGFIVLKFNNSFFLKHINPKYIKEAI